MIRLLLISCVFIILYACNGDIHFKDRILITKGEWNYGDSVEFSFLVSDTIKSYDIILDIDHARDFGYQNFYTEILTIFPDNDTVSTIVPINLADKLGQWEGLCKGLECSVKYNLKTNSKFPQPGQYQFIFNQHTRESTLKGLLGLGLVIQEAE